MREKKRKDINCKYCFQLLSSDYYYAKHIVAKHPNKMEEYVLNG